MNQVTTLAPGMTGPLGLAGAAADAYIPDWLVTANFTVFSLWFLLWAWWLIYTTLAAERRAKRLELSHQLVVPPMASDADRHLAPMPPRATPDSGG